MHLPWSVAVVGQGHGADAELVEHSQSWQAAVDGMPPFDTYQAGYLLPRLGIIQSCKGRHTCETQAALF